jgi:ferredoxin
MSTRFGGEISARWIQGGFMKIAIDPDVCVGHGRCYSLVPELFDSDDAGHGVVLKAEVLSSEEIALAERAAANCPEGAIKLS